MQHDKAKWRINNIGSSVFSAFGVYYRQLRVKISSRGTLQQFTVWRLPMISNLRCNVGEWNVFAQASIGFWNSVFVNLGHLRHTFLFPFWKTEIYCHFAVSYFKHALFESFSYVIFEFGHIGIWSNDEIWQEKQSCLREWVKVWRTSWRSCWLS